jgi:hypothetical protein
MKPRIYFCETSRLQQFLDNRLTDNGVVVRIMRRPHFTPKEDSWYSFLLEAVDPRAIVQLEGLGKLNKKIHDLIGNRTHYRLLPWMERVVV